MYLALAKNTNRIDSDIELNKQLSKNNISVFIKRITTFRKLFFINLDCFSTFFAKPITFLFFYNIYISTLI